MGAPASTASDDVVRNSVHVSTKNLVDTSILKPSAAIKVPRLDAYNSRDESRRLDGRAYQPRFAAGACGQ
jgi:hypothetical protein